MIKSNKAIIRLFVLIVAIAAVAAGVLRTVLLLKYIDPASGFYSVDTNLDVVFNVIVFAVVAIVAVGGFFARKMKTPEHLDSRSTVVVFASALCAFIYISMFIYGIYCLVKAEGRLDIFLFVQTVLCIPCCLNHISICSVEVREKNKPHAFFSMAEALFFGVRIVDVFMDTTTQINASQRSLELLMLCSMMLFFLFETNFLVKREEGNLKSPSKYYMAGLASVAFPALSVIPYLLVSLFWCFEANYLIMDVLSCCVMLFAASRLLTVGQE